MASNKNGAQVAAPQVTAPQAPNALLAAYQQAAAQAAAPTPTRAGGGAGWPLAATVQVLHTNHGSKPGSKRAAILVAVLAHLGGGGTVGGALAIARAAKGGPEDLRLLVAAGCIAAPVGVPVATRAQVAAAAQAAAAATLAAPQA